SRFLLEVARDGCDLGSAEGRAHLASNARPLWSALPEGALKRQILGEIAELVQLDAREISALWTPGAAPRAPASAPRGAGEGRGRPSEPRHSARAPAPHAPLRGRARPLSRADHAARLMLADMAAWEAQPHEVHALLCELPGEHGQLFAWLDRQWQE